MRTAYYIAKNDRPYSDHPNLLELQMLNGLEFGLGLRSRLTATNMIDHVAVEMRSKICSRIQEINGKIALLFDESTTFSNKSTLIVYLKCEMAKDQDPLFFSLELIELENQNSAIFTDSIIQCLSKYKFSENYLKQNLIAITTDGASVMLGNKSGVAIRFLHLYPNIYIWHCLIDEA